MKKIISITLPVVLLLTIAVSCSSSPDIGDVGTSYGSLPSDCTIEAFLSHTCAYCKRMEAYLKKKNIPYTKRDVANDYWARQDFYALGGTGVPLLRMGKTVITGYKPEEVDQAFRAYCKISE